MARGIEITQNGTDIKFAADYQKVLDSRWKFLEIVNEQIFSWNKDTDLTGNIPLTKILDHNLGYLPAFTHSGSFNTFNDIFYADTKSIYADTNFSSGGTEFIRVFACDITAEYKAPSSIVTGAGSSSRSSSGIKILNQNANNINSTSGTDFSIDTDYHQMSVHLTGTRTVNTQGHLVLTHDVGYPPSYFVAAIKNNITGLSTAIKAMNSIFGFALANSYQIDISGAQAALTGSFGVLILKDPLDVAS